MRVINWNLAKHPMNWVIVTLMLLIPLIAVHLILGWQTNPSSTTTPATI